MLDKSTAKTFVYVSYSAYFLQGAGLEKMAQKFNALIVLGEDTVNLLG